MTPSERLAIDGGPAVLPAGPPDWPPPDAEVAEALARAAGDGSWGRYHGPHGTQLTERLAELFDIPHVTLCCSGTIAVELALRGLRVGPADEVILAGYDFGGNFHSILATGAQPVLVDIDPARATLDPTELAGALSKQTKAIVVSHLHGGVARMPAICEFAAEHGLAVVEDACQMPGGTLEGRPLGTWGDVGVLSFGGSKLLTAGRGGALLTRRADVHQRIKLLTERGNQTVPLSELQAAVLLPQLDRLAERNARRRAAVERLTSQLRELPGLSPLGQADPDAEPGYYKLGWRYDAEQFGGRSRDDFSAAVRAEGVALDPAFRDFAGKSRSRCRHVGSLTHSREAGRSLLVLHHPVLLEANDTLDAVAQGIAKVARAWSGQAVVNEKR